MDKEFKKNLTTERVVILTAEVLIEGTMYHHQEIRLSDSLNAPQYRDNPYMTLADAIVTKIESDHVVFRSNVLMVARSRILCMTPKSEVLACGLPSLAAPCPKDTKRDEIPIADFNLPKVGVPATAPSPTAPLGPTDLGNPKEKRSSPRRKANMQPVLITNGDPKAPPFEGWLVDRSAGGMRLVVKRPVAEGAFVSVRTARASISSSWLKLEVRNSKSDNGTTHLGCRFVLKPSLEELQQFG
jgi:hypothetical protein